MKQFLDFLPLIVFFAFYKLYDIYAGTLALIVATAVVLIYSWVRYRKVEKMALITFLMVAVFGGLTLFFHNDEFIKWKVTVIYGGRAAHQPVGDEEAADPAHAGERTDAAAGCVGASEYRLGAIFYSVWSGEYLYRILAAAEYLGQLQGVWPDGADPYLHPAQRRLYLSPHAAG